jgi:multidrug efflux pump subunit AcrB
MQKNNSPKPHSNHSFSILIIFALLSLLGTAAIPLLSIDLEPEIHKSSISVECTWQNKRPLFVETEVTSILEAVFSVMEGLSDITSVSSKGKSSITLEFDNDVDLDKARLELVSIIRRMFPKLPAGTTFPSVTFNLRGNTNNQPLLIYTLDGTHPTIELKNFALKNIRKQLSTIEGIERIEVSQGSSQEWRISYSADKMKTYGITGNDLSVVLNNYFNEESIGTEVINHRYQNGTVNMSIPVNLCSPKWSNDVWNKIPIKKLSNRIIHLSDIANVDLAKQSDNYFFRVNGNNAVNIVIIPQKDANTIRVASKTKAVISSLINQLPSGYHLIKSYDSTVFIKDELNKIFTRSIYTVIILLFFVFIVTLSFRYLMSIVLSISVNILICFAIYYLLKVNIHLYSLAGITVSLGLIIDNTIIMTDHIKHNNNIRIYIPLLASTITTIGSLLVVTLLPESIKLRVWDFAAVIIINLAVSLIISLWFIPALQSFIKDKKPSRIKFNGRTKMIVTINKFYFFFLKILIKRRILVLTIVLLLCGLPIFLLPNSLKETSQFARLYNQTLGHEWYISNVKPMINKILGGSLRLFSFYVFENSYNSNPRQTRLYVCASLPTNNMKNELNNIYHDLEDYLKQYPGIEHFITTIYNQKYAEMVISFEEEYEENKLPHLLKSRFISKSLNIGGINWSIYGVGNSYSRQTGISETVDYKVALYGYNYHDLEKYALIFKEKLQSNPRIKDFTFSANKSWSEGNKTKGYKISVDKRKLAFYNINNFDIYSQITHFDQSEKTRLNITTYNKNEQITITQDADEIYDVWNMMNRPFGERYTKLKEFLSIYNKPETENIYKENQNYLRLVNFKYMGSSKLGNNHLDRVLSAIEPELPMGYSIVPLTRGYNFDKHTESYPLLLLLVMVLIFIICSVLFESILQPLVISFLVPTSFTGIFLTFYLFDLNFDQGGYASFILLSGLVVNSAIYIVNEYNNVKTINNSRVIHPIKLYIKAINNKIVPISLTILSTILGLIPFMIFGQNDVFWFALAAGTIGGLVYSFVLITVVLGLFINKK